MAFNPSKNGCDALGIRDVQKYRQAELRTQHGWKFFKLIDSLLMIARCNKPGRCSNTASKYEGDANQGHLQVFTARRCAVHLPEPAREVNAK